MPTTDDEPTPSRPPSGAPLDHARRRARVDRAVSWLAWWAPELAVALLLAATALAYPVTGVVTVPLAAGLLGSVLGRPLAWRARAYWRARQQARERCVPTRDERARTGADHAVSNDADDRGVAG